MSKRTPTAVRLIKEILSTHRQLSTREIWAIGTDGLKPVLPPAHEVTDGRIRMKRVATMREGSRIWVPPPEPPMPDHPFLSVNFLKGTILASLESQNLIHKTTAHRPLQNDEERRVAAQTAARMTRRLERQAMKNGDPPPPPVMPATSTKVWGWTLGPKPTPNYGNEEGEDAERGRESDAGASGNNSNGYGDQVGVGSGTGASTDRGRIPWPEKKVDSSDSRAGSRNTESSSSTSTPRASSSSSTAYTPSAKPEGFTTLSLADQAAWHRAERLEEQYHRAKAHEAELISHRRETRREVYKAQRERMKAERAEDLRMGRVDFVRQEKKRMDAIAEIGRYAAMTGEDVSEWYQELGIKDPGKDLDAEMGAADGSGADSVDYDFNAPEDAGFKASSRTGGRGREQRWSNDAMDSGSNFGIRRRGLDSSAAGEVMPVRGDARADRSSSYLPYPAPRMTTRPTYRDSDQKPREEDGWINYTDRRDDHFAKAHNDGGPHNILAARDEERRDKVKVRAMTGRVSAHVDAVAGLPEYKGHTTRATSAWSPSSPYNNPPRESAAPIRESESSTRPSEPARKGGMWSDAAELNDRDINRGKGPRGTTSSRSNFDYKAGFGDVSNFERNPGPAGRGFRMRGGGGGGGSGMRGERGWGGGGDRFSDSNTRTRGGFGMKKA